MCRFCVNFMLVFGYYGFWHIVLDVLGWSERPFHPRRQVRVTKVVHNMWYTLLGVAQFTGWEAVFLHCYSTKRLPFLSQALIQS